MSDQPGEPPGQVPLPGAVLPPAAPPSGRRPGRPKPPTPRGPADAAGGGGGDRPPSTGSDRTALGSPAEPAGAPEHAARELTEERVRQIVLEQQAIWGKAQELTEERVQEIVIEQQAQTGVSEEILHEKLDFHKTNCREMVLLHLSQGSQSALGAPPTSLGAFTATQHARALAQDKAVWPAMSYSTLKGVPQSAMAGTTSALSHQDLERKLAARAFSIVPDHTQTGGGFSEVVIHDMVNAVVQDIVGTFESLLDRLLIEKKQDTIRVMVAELLTEDLTATIATGREQLKKQEMGHIIDELGRLRQELHESESSWESRFMLAHQLRETQDDMKATVHEQHQDHAGRLGKVEREFVHVSELDTRLKVVAEELAELRVHAMSNMVKHEELGERQDNFEAFCNETFAMQKTLVETEEKLDKDIASARARTEEGLAELREYSAAEDRVADLQANHEERLKRLRVDLAQEKANVEILSEKFKKDQRFNIETYATKTNLGEQLAVVREDREQLARDLTRTLDRMEASFATTKSLEEGKKNTLKEIGWLQQKLEDTNSTLNENTVDLRALEDRADNVLATRDFATEVAAIQAKRIGDEYDEREDLAQLRREFEEERERLRQNIRQTQSSRKDLTDTQEVLHEVRLHSNDVQKTCGSLTDRLKHLVEREDAHWQQQNADAADWRQNQNDLEVQYQMLKEELRCHQDYQKTENERLRHHSTQRYLEQMDKALSLNSTVGRLEVGHRELKDTVIRLPRVQADSPRGDGWPRALT